MAQREDLTGKRFGFLIVRAFSHSDKKRRSIWTCKCKCGKETKVRKCSLISGRTKSCGCFNIESSQTHGMKKTKVYKVWDSMKQRCNNKNHKQYKNYGGKGIKFCKKWEKFENFYSDMGEPNGLTLDRINNDGDYKPSNCRWVSSKVQNNNTSRNVRIIFNSEKRTLAEWSEKVDIPYSTLYDRYKRNWNIKDMLSKERRINQYR